MLLENILQLHPLRGARVLIGPEGGWSQAERDLIGRVCCEKQKTTHLTRMGPIVLKVDTAVIYAASLLSAYFRSTDLPAAAGQLLDKWAQSQNTQK